MEKVTTYWDFLKLDQLLALQNGIAESEESLSNDEVMFIVIHQIDELWFKLLIRELVAARDLFSRNPVPEQSLANAARSIRRVTVLLSQIANHFALMETMTTRDYLEFRDKLSPASGFQSGQLRQIEFLLGLRDEDRVLLNPDHDHLSALREHDGSESASLRELQRRMDHERSLREVVRDWIFRTPVQGSVPEHTGDAATVHRFIRDYLDSHARSIEETMGFALRGKRTAHEREKIETRFAQERDAVSSFLYAEEVPKQHRERSIRIRAATLFIESYRELPLLAWPREVLDSLVGLEQAFVIFRQRHARMVERIIGRRTGTGGSSGVDYLDRTALKYRVFEDLWAVRGLLIRRDLLPALDNRDYYGFSADSVLPPSPTRG